jgi:hypothetical protein
VRIKKLLLSFVILFVLAYVSFGVWIAHDTKTILQEAMKGNSDSGYMSNTAYNNINPAGRGMTSGSFKYDKSLHHIGFVLPFHFFFVSRAFVTQDYSSDDLAFREPIRLSLVLKSGKWYATKASIRP